MKPTSPAIHFTTGIVISKARTYLIIPFDPNETWGVKEQHHVAGSINGCPVRGSLIADGDQFLLQLGPAWLRDAKINVTESIQVELAPEGPQIDALAPDIIAAFDAAPQAKRFFESLATFYREGYMRSVNGNKRPDIRQARIAEMISFLHAGKKQR